MHVYARAAEKAFHATICPLLRTLNLDPFDVKPIFHPIDFVVFKGMTNEEATSEIIMLTREHNCPSINPIRDQIRKAVAKYRYNWQVTRIEEEGNIIIE